MLLVSPVAAWEKFLLPGLSTRAVVAEGPFYENPPPLLHALMVSVSMHITDKKLAKLRCLVHHATRRLKG
ncbi:hypothetical protein D8L93_08120 [Sodalis-like symbiont of Bactericera trigonica]|nr:hypothetical protein D8L93_08120 [Sodalis-like symbiont of Bactericera trigonica]